MLKPPNWSRFDVAALVLLGLAAVGILWLTLPREQSQRARCQDNLMQLGMALKQYVSTHGGGTFYPYPAQDAGYAPPTGEAIPRGRGFSGASFLAALYWSGVVTQPGLFLCPDTSDSNRFGRDLGTNPSLLGGKPNVPGWSADFEKPDGSHVSYASKAQWTMPLGQPLAAPLPDRMVMAADDTDGERNHPGGINILYNDGHVEFKPDPSEEQ